MKRSTSISYLLATLFLMWPLSAIAAPFLVCDPQADVDYYVVTGLPAPIDGSHVAPDSTGTFGFKLDLGTLPVGGPYAIKAKACNNAWGCSADSLPFVFTRPAALTTPADVRLSR